MTPAIAPAPRQGTGMPATPYLASPRFSPAGIAGIVAAHVGVLALLATLEVVPLPAPLATLMVDIIQPAPPPPAPEITPPKPQPLERKPQPRPKPVPREQPRMLAAQSDAPSSAPEVPVIKEEPPPAPPAPPAPAAPAPVTQARFDADYLQNPAPAYPALSRRMGEEGKVILRVFVEPSGRPSQIELKASSGSPRLDQAAQDAVWRWKFVPARRGDETIAAWVLVPIVFNLRS